MKHLKRMAVVVAALASLFAVAAPSNAAGATELAIEGRITVGTGMQHGATVLVDGVCAGAAATTQPSVSPYTCGLLTSGTLTGSCSAWTARVSGSLNPTIDLLVNAPRYRVNLTLTAAQGVVTITGTATDAAGSTKSVVGGGVATLRWDTGSTCGNNAHSYVWAGTLTIAG